MNKLLIKKFIDIFTSVLSFFAILFVAERFYSNQIWKLNLLSFNYLLAIIAIGSFAFFFDTAIPAISWKLLLEWFGEAPKPFAVIYSIYGRSQIAKYLPGNIFQLTNRHVISLNSGSKNGSLIGAAFFEIMSSVVGSTVLCLIGYFLGVRYERLSISVILLIIVLSSSGVAFFIYITPIITSRLPFLNKIFGDLQVNSRGTFWTFAPIAVLIFFYLLFANIIFCFVTIAVNGSITGLSIPLVISIYSIAYLVGMITPGAPAGIGIRESIMVLLLSPIIGVSKATYISLVFRVITTLGDVWFFIIASFVDRNIRRNGED
jgi:glycosyltransferase 2 family protein